MRVTRIPAAQAHYVPDQAYRIPSDQGVSDHRADVQSEFFGGSRYGGRAIFDPSIFDSKPIDAEYIPEPDGGGDPVPEDGTAQNGFQPVTWYRCRLCEGAVRENEIDAHRCQEDG